MPKSRNRTKRTSLFSGLPQRIVDLSPPDWTEARRAAWCRAYLDGSANAHAGTPLKLDRTLHSAFRQGQKDAELNKGAVAQRREDRRIAAIRQERYNEMADRADARRDALRDRLGRLAGDPDGSILSLAGAAMNIGAAGLGLGALLGGRRGGRD